MRSSPDAWYAPRRLTSASQARRAREPEPSLRSLPANRRKDAHAPFCHWLPLLKVGRKAAMTNRIRTGIALLMLSHGLVGCADQGSPTAPSAPPPPSVQQPSPQPTGIQPSITAIAPHVGSTRGGAWATITGVDFQPGAKVRLGDTTVSSWTRDSTTISVLGTAAHAAGTIDVIVTNPGGLEARLSGG